MHEPRYKHKHGLVFQVRLKMSMIWESKLLKLVLQRLRMSCMCTEDRDEVHDSGGVVQHRIGHRAS